MHVKIKLGVIFIKTIFQQMAVTFSGLTKSVYCDNFLIDGVQCYEGEALFYNSQEDTRWTGSNPTSDCSSILLPSADNLPFPVS